MFAYADLGANASPISEGFSVWHLTRPGSVTPGREWTPVSQQGSLPPKRGQGGQLWIGGFLLVALPIAPVSRNRRECADTLCRGLNEAPTPCITHVRPMHAIPCGTGGDSRAAQQATAQLLGKQALLLRPLQSSVSRVASTSSSPNATTPKKEAELHRKVRDTK
jgi:hypothetical protein